ncbi:nucleotidyltransferase [Paenisporosarcina macmurdoensis]|uniref:Nucleotidyltransferase n=1 Tax=Paenisporosarcina macmurdoensis TaxID=212659 RepID=A0ABW1L9C0_9BACL
MSRSVITAFNEFQKDTVNLDTNLNDRAKRSKNWLLEKISKFDSTVENFPLLYPKIDIHFGSYARKTKIRELDDIDLMIGLNAQGSTHAEYSNRIEIHVSDKATNLLRLCHPQGNVLNSKRVINKFVSACENIPQYNNADIKRNQEAATLKLSSYTWNFDIVPCFITQENSDGETFYLIPDGNGHWKKTNPRLDKERASLINQSHDGNVLQAIRIMKYWNRRVAMPTITSYLLETIILNYYKANTNKASSYVDIEIPKILNYLYDNILGDINDPKNIQGNINGLTFDERYRVRTKASSDYTKAIAARKLEEDGNNKSSINKWREIFGDNFPKYE